MTDTNDQSQFTHYEVKRAELVEDRAAAQAKVEKIDAAIAKLDAQQANVDAIEALKSGDNVAYVYGRAANKRILSGTVAATKKNEKGAVQLKVEHGTGFDAEFHLIDSSALLFTAEEIEAAQTDIDATVATAKAAEAATQAAT